MYTGCNFFAPAAACITQPKAVMFAFTHNFSIPLNGIGCPLCITLIGRWGKSKKQHKKLLKQISPAMTRWLQGCYRLSSGWFVWVTTWFSPIVMKAEYFTSRSHLTRERSPEFLCSAFPPAVTFHVFKSPCREFFHRFPSICLLCVAQRLSTNPYSIAYLRTLVRSHFSSEGAGLSLLKPSKTWRPVSSFPFPRTVLALSMFWYFCLHNLVLKPFTLA